MISVDSENRQTNIEMGILIVYMTKSEWNQ